MMLKKLERRNYSAGTTRRYLRFVERFAQHFRRSPDKLGPDDLRGSRPICSGSLSSAREASGPRGRTAVLLRAHASSP